MKRYFKALGILVAVLAIVLCIPSVKSSASSYKTGIYKINTKETGLNVRSCYGSDYMKVGTVDKGTKVNVTFVSSNGWGKITVGDIHGWISLEYCKYIGAAEDSSEGKSQTSKTKNSDRVNFGISADNLTWVWGCKQEYSKKSGLCTSCATGTLLRRRQAAEGKEVTYTFGDTRSSCGGNPVPDKKGYYESCSFYYTPENGWIHVDEETGEKTVYYTVKEEKTTHTHNREYLVDLLDVHPEGVVVYVNYGSSGRHAILISDYIRHKDGSLTFYAYDPANKGARLKLEDTWIMTKFRSVGGFFSNVRAIWYIKGELTVDDSMFDHPEAEAFSEIVVATRKTKLFAKADTDSDSVASVEKGDIFNIDFKLSDKNGTVWYITSENAYIKAERVRKAKEADILAAEEKAAKEAEAASSEETTVIEETETPEGADIVTEAETTEARTETAGETQSTETQSTEAQSIETVEANEDSEIAETSETAEE